MSWSWRRQLYLLYSAAAYFCFLLVLIGLAEATWAEGTANQITFQFGLLSFCRHYGDDERHVCGSYGYGDMPLWFDVCRTFCYVSAVFLFSVMPVTLYLHYNDDRKEDIFHLTGFGVFAGVLGLVGATLYFTMWNMETAGVTWALAVYTAGHVTAVVVFLTLCVASQIQTESARTTRVNPRPYEPWKP